VALLSRNYQEMLSDLLTREKNILELIVHMDQSVECHVVVQLVMKYMALANAVQRVCSYLSQIMPLQKDVTNMNAEYFPLPSSYYTTIDNKIQGMQNTLEEARQGAWDAHLPEDAQTGGWMNDHKCRRI
jgi:hypothetical protein